MPAPFELLSALRVNAIMQGLQDPRLIPAELVWNQRIPDVPAVDEEIMARFIGIVQAADIIMDDQKAVTYNLGRYQFEANKIPNLKIGIPMTQVMLNQFGRLSGQINPGNDLGIFQNWENRLVQSLDTGIRQRKEALFISMLTDNLQYDRLGVKLSGIGWGMPPDLKITPAIPWTSTSATPLTDIQNCRLIASQRYGIDYDFMQLSLSDFVNMTNTTQFQNQVKLWAAASLISGTPIQFPVQNYGVLKGIAQQMLMGPTGGPLEIELYDNRYFTQDPNGLVSSSRFLPLGSVILTRKGMFGDSNVWDFANGVCTETVVSSVARPSGAITGFTEPKTGPIAYPTIPADMNPPGITYWGVCRGFPRKKLLQASACLQVGAGVEVVPSGVPFPS